VEENDPTAVEPDELEEISGPIEDQDPPEGFEPQPELEPGQSPDIVERDGTTLGSLDDEIDVVDPADGEADNGDDDSEDDEDDSDNDDNE
jgi:hypothetical protein